MDAFIYLLLIGINIPAVVQKENSTKGLNYFAIGFISALLVVYIIESL